MFAPTNIRLTKGDRNFSAKLWESVQCEAVQHEGALSRAMVGGWGSEVSVFFSTGKCAWLAVFLDSSIGSLLGTEFRT